MVPIHSRMFGTYWDKEYSIPTISYLHISYLFLFILVHSWTCSWYILLYSWHIRVLCRPVCLCLSVLHSYWFVLIRVNLYHVRGAFPLLLTTNISRTSRNGSNHYKNAVRTCWMNYEFSTNSKRYTNEYECFKQPDTFVSTLRTTKILWTM